MTAQQLKNSILQMAVQGKLVPQDPNDEPASVLLERIRAEKQALIKAGKIKKEKPQAPITDEEIPFDIPESWEWVRCSTLGAIIRGSGIKRTETVESGMPCVRYGELYTTYNTSFTKTISFVPQELYEQCKQISYGDVLFTLTGENKPDIAKTVAYLGDSPVAVGGDLAYWTHHGMNPLYLVYFMSSPYAIGRKVNLSTGDIIVHISGDKVGSFLIPVPPLAEQDRIVAQINELEPIIQEYQTKEQAVSALNTSFPEAMKKSILQEAVQGKLVPQNPDDEPASVLLERIKAEKQKLIKAGKIKKEKPLAPITEDEIPFEIPESWEWVQLETICSSITDGDHQPPPQVSNGKPFIVISNVSDGSIDFSNTRFVSDEYYNSLDEKRKPQMGDILFTVTGSYGIVLKVNTNIEFCFQRHIALLKSIIVDVDFLVHWLTTPLVYEQCKEKATGTAQKTVGLTSLKSIIIPLPPLEEQKRIVAKIEELTKYCEML